VRGMSDGFSGKGGGRERLETVQGSPIGRFAPRGKSKDADLPLWRCGKASPSGAMPEGQGNLSETSAALEQGPLAEQQCVALDRRRLSDARSPTAPCRRWRNETQDFLWKIDFVRRVSFRSGRAQRRVRSPEQHLWRKREDDRAPHVLFKAGPFGARKRWSSSDGSSATARRCRRPSPARSRRRFPAVAGRRCRI
jgi:hypothetical protein